MRLKPEEKRFRDFVSEWKKQRKNHPIWEVEKFPLEKLVEMSNEYPKGKLFFRIWENGRVINANVEEMSAFLFERIELFGWTIIDVHYDRGCFDDGTVAVCHVYIKKVKEHENEVNH